MGRGKRGAGGSAALRAGRGWGGGDPGSLPVSGGRGSGGPRAPGEVGWGGGPGRLGGPQRGSEGGGGGGRRAAPAPAARLEHEPSIRPREDAAAAEPGPGLRAPPVSSVPGASGLARGGGRAARPGKMLRAGPHCPLTGTLEKTPRRRARPSLRAGTQRPALAGCAHSPPPG